MASFIVLFTLFFVALFAAFSLSKNDIVLIKEKIDTSRIFNLFFLNSIISIVIGRVFYVLEVSRLELLSPLVFVHLLKFPGFSFFGASIGFVVALFFFVKEREAIRRIYDIFIISFLPLILFGVLSRINIFINFFVILLPLFFVVPIIWIMIKSYKNYFLRDGSLFLISFITFSLIELLLGTISRQTKLLFNLSFSQLVSVFVLGVLLVLLARNESIFSYVRKRLRR